MQVRIRRASEQTGRFLTTTSLDKLDQVIPTLEKWTIASDEGLPLIGQFWVDGQDGIGAFFEVVIDDSEVSDA